MHWISKCSRDSGPSPIFLSFTKLKLHPFLPKLKWDSPHHQIQISYSQVIHVWYIDIHLVDVYDKFQEKYTINGSYGIYIYWLLSDNCKSNFIPYSYINQPLCCFFLLHKVSNSKTNPVTCVSIYTPENQHDDRCNIHHEWRCKMYFLLNMGILTSWKIHHESVDVFPIVSIEIFQRSSC